MLHWRLFLSGLFIGVLALFFWFEINTGQPGILLFPLALLTTLGHPALYLLWVAGVVLLVAGAVFWILGAIGRPVAGRRAWY